MWDPIMEADVAHALQVSRELPETYGEEGVVAEDGVQNVCQNGLPQENPQVAHKIGFCWALTDCSRIHAGYGAGRPFLVWLIAALE